MDSVDPSVLATLRRLQESFVSMEAALAALLAHQAPALVPAPKLPHKQHQFMELLCHSAGYTYQQIASLLGVALSTVHTHRNRLCKRFGVNSKQGLVNLGLSWGMRRG